MNELMIEAEKQIVWLKEQLEKSNRKLYELSHMVGTLRAILFSCDHYVSHAQDEALKKVDELTAKIIYENP